MYVILILLAAVFALPALAQEASDCEMGKPCIDPEQVSISGLSSGAFMAQQVYITHSKLFMGLGTLSGGPYGCAKINEGRQIPEAYRADFLNHFYKGKTVPDFLKTAPLRRAENAAFWCMYESAGTLDPEASQNLELAKAQEKIDQSIDPLENLKGDRVFIFNSKQDKTVFETQGQKQKAFYKNLIDGGDLKYLNAYKTSKGRYDVAHGIATYNPLFKSKREGQTACLKSDDPARSSEQFIESHDPFIYFCDAIDDRDPSLIYQMLHHLYPDLKQPLNPVQSEISNQDFYEIAQGNFFEPVQYKEWLNNRSLGEFAYAYIPAQCLNQTRCKLHVALHGCKQFPAYELPRPLSGKFGDLFYKNIYTRVAQENDLVVLYPQSDNVNFAFANPNGCWDFWGQFPEEFETFTSKQARQIQMITKMITAFVEATIDYRALGK